MNAARVPRLAFALVALLASLAVSSCASERGARGPADAPSDGPRYAASAAPADGALERQWLERVRAREARQATRAWRCLVEKTCDDEPDDERSARDRQDLELALEVLRQPGAERGEERLSVRAAARVALEEAASSSEAARLALEDGLVLHHGREMPFAYADLPLALAQAEPSKRLALLAAASPIVVQRASLAPAATEAREALVARAGRTTEELLALRAGIDARELRALVEEILARTAAYVPALPNGPADIPALLARHEGDLDPQSARRGALVSGFGGFAGRRAGTNAPVSYCVVVDPPEDVRFVEGATSPPSLSRYARACAAAGARLGEGPWDPAWLHVVASVAREGTWLAGPPGSQREAAGRRHATLVLEARRLALEVKAWLDDVHEPSALDALATSWTSPQGAPVPGASALLALDPSGAAADALVALVLAAALDNALAARFGPAWAADAGNASLVEQEIDALGAVWHEAGPRGVLRALGLTSVDAAPLLARIERLAR